MQARLRGTHNLEPHTMKVSNLGFRFSHSQKPGKASLRVQGQNKVSTNALNKQ